LELGSVHDADDALQETLLRAWRGLSGFQGRSGLRSWLYRIATNVCLAQIARRPKRVLPIDYGSATDPHVAPFDPVAESVALEPYPDESLGMQDGFAAPEARFEQRVPEQPPDHRRLAGTFDRFGLPGRLL
jgi:RNA polymerase sigma-70 factor, ECF subfamily